MSYKNVDAIIFLGSNLKEYWNLLPTWIAQIVNKSKTLEDASWLDFQPKIKESESAASDNDEDGFFQRKLDEVEEELHKKIQYLKNNELEHIIEKVLMKHYTKGVLNEMMQQVEVCDESLLSPFLATPQYFESFVDIPNCYYTDYISLDILSFSERYEKEKSRIGKDGWY